MRRSGSSRAVLAAVSCILAAICLSGCNRAEPAKTAAKPAAPAAASPPDGPQVHVVEVSQQAWPRTVRAQGTLIEDEFALLGAKMAGRVKQVQVDIGTRVAAGQVVATLETEDFDLNVQQAEAQVAQARASVGLKPGVPDEKLDPTKAPPVLQEFAMLEEARFNYNRVRGLIGKGVVTQEELQAREAALRVAEARYASAANAVDEQIALLKLRRSELAMAEQNRQDAVLRAPFVGVIQETHVAPGSYVNVGQQMVTLVRTDPLRFRAGVPERSAIGVTKGQPVRIMLEGRAKPLEAVISRISPALDVSSRALIIECDIENKDDQLRSGLFAEADILVDPNQRALTVPASSVISFGGVEKVWTVKDNKAQPQPIRVGRREGNRVEVLSGLSGGEWIFTNGEQGREGVVRAVRDAPSDHSADRAAMTGG